jgi:DNA-binding TFAR19-related protein (PDSD5 family)
VSPERAKQIEAILVRMAQSGQLRGRVTEEQLIGFLDQVRRQTVPASQSCKNFSDGGVQFTEHHQKVHDCGR